MRTEGSEWVLRPCLFSPEGDFQLESPPGPLPLSAAAKAPMPSGVLSAGIES